MCGHNRKISKRRLLHRNVRLINTRNVSINTRQQRIAAPTVIRRQLTRIWNRQLAIITQRNCLALCLPLHHHRLADQRQATRSTLRRPYRRLATLPRILIITTRMRYPRSHINRTRRRHLSNVRRNIPLPRQRIRADIRAQPAGSVVRRVRQRATAIISTVNATARRRIYLIEPCLARCHLAHRRLLHRHREDNIDLSRECHLALWRYARLIRKRITVTRRRNVTTGVVPHNRPPRVI